MNEQEAINYVTSELLAQQKQHSKHLFIALLISIIANIAIVSGFLIYESQWEYSVEETTSEITVAQEQSEKGGDNVFQTGEYATYSALGVEE